MVVFTAAAALAIPSLPSAASADAADSISSLFRGGEWVRIIKRGATSAASLTGIYRSATAESVEIDQVNPHTKFKVPLSVPIDGLARIEVSRGRTHHTLAGALVGALATGAFTLAAFSGDESDEAPVSLVLLVFVPLGALTGALVGSGFESDRWEIVWEQPSGP